MPIININQPNHPANSQPNITAEPRVVKNIPSKIPLISKKTKKVILNIL